METSLAPKAASGRAKRKHLKLSKNLFGQVTFFLLGPTGNNVQLTLLVCQSLQISSTVWWNHLVMTSHLCVQMSKLTWCLKLAVTLVVLYLLDSIGMVITCEQCGQTTYHTVRIPVACTKHWHLDHPRSHHTLLSRYIQHTILHVQHMHCLGQLTALLLLNRNLYMHMNNNNELYSITNASHAL